MAGQRSRAGRERWQGEGKSSSDAASDVHCWQQGLVSGERVRDYWYQASRRTPAVERVLDSPEGAVLALSTGPAPHCPQHHASPRSLGDLREVMFWTLSPERCSTRRPPVQGWASTRAMRKGARVPREYCAAMRITAEGIVHYEVRASVRPRGRRSGVERRSVQGLVSKQQAAARPKRASTTMLDTCMERIETCDSATWSSLPVPITPPSGRGCDTD